MAEVYYFGCKDRAGHHLHASSGRSVSYHDAPRLRVPCMMDGDAAFLPYPEKIGEGALTYLPANDLTILAWWGNPWDSRPGVNNSVMVRGRHDLDAVWSVFEQTFHDLAPKLKKPNVNRTDAGSAKVPESQVKEAWIHAYTSLGCDRANAEKMVNAEIAAAVEAWGMGEDNAGRN